MEQYALYSTSGVAPLRRGMEFGDQAQVHKGEHLFLCPAGRVLGYNQERLKIGINAGRC